MGAFRMMDSYVKAIVKAMTPQRVRATSTNWGIRLAPDVNLIWCAARAYGLGVAVAQAEARSGVNA